MGYEKNNSDLLCFDLSLSIICLNISRRARLRCSSGTGDGAEHSLICHCGSYILVQASLLKWKRSLISAGNIQILTRYEAFWHRFKKKNSPQNGDKTQTLASGLSPDLLLGFHLALCNSFHLSGPPFPTFTQGTALQWVSCSLIFETRSEIPQMEAGGRNHYCYIFIARFSLQAPGGILKSPKSWARRSKEQSE